MRLLDDEADSIGFARRNHCTEGNVQKSRIAQFLPTVLMLSNARRARRCRSYEIGVSVRRAPPFFSQSSPQSRHQDVNATHPLAVGIMMFYTLFLNVHAEDI